MCILFANLFMLLTWGLHMVYHEDPYIFYIYMIKCGWLGQPNQPHLFNKYQISMGFSYYHVIGVSGIHLLVLFHIDVVKSCGQH